MKTFFQLIFGFTCLLVLSCQNGSDNNTNKTDNHFSTLSKNNLSNKNNGVVRTFFRFPGANYTIRLDPINRLLYIEGDMLFTLITLPPGWVNMFGAVLTMAVREADGSISDYFYTINANGDLGIIIRNRSTLQIQTQLRQRFLPLQDGETIIDMASDEDGETIFMSQSRIFVVLVNFAGGSWFPDYSRDMSILPSLRFTPRLISIDYERSNRTYLITYANPQTDRDQEVGYFYSRSRGWWSSGADGIPQRPGFRFNGGDTGLIDPLSFLTWRGYISSDFSQVLVCPITYNTSKFSKANESPACITESTPTTQNIIGNASNYLSLPYPAESSIIDIAIGEGGDVIRSSDKGKSWSLTARLYDSANVSSLYGIIYNESKGFFEVAGYDKKGKEITLISADGVFWANPNIPNFSKVFASNNSFCGLVNDSKYPEKAGYTYCWGSNASNQLGLGSAVVTDKALVPVPLSNGAGGSSPPLFTNIVGGEDFFCAYPSTQGAQKANTPYCWGAGGLGQLGDKLYHEHGYNNPVPSPIAMPSEVALPVKVLVAGDTHNCLLDNNGHPFCWGSNSLGQVDATSSQQIFFSPVMASYNQSYNYKDIALGENFTAGYVSLSQLKTSGPKSTIYAWGKNYPVSSGNPLTRIAFKSGEDVDFGSETGLYAGGDTACLLGDQIGPSRTNAWCFGGNSYGKMGDGTINPSYTEIHNVQSPQSSALTFKSLSISELSICGVTQNNLLYCWGNNDFAQSGIGESGPNILGPQIPVQLNGKAAHFSSVATGLKTVCGVNMDDNNTYCWGFGTNGQLGNRSTFNSVTPVVVNTVIDTESGNPLLYN